ncbi:MAG: hypothetical protein F4X65_03900 [Chloroflexi bacterium]|nr:hypothetical protein [Chloroflexota bacterium]
MVDVSQTTPVLLATGNIAKQRALRELLEGLPLHPVTPAELGLSADPEETAETHEAIAVEKAVEWSRLAGMLSVASDGGLVVPFLGPNWESRYTHRFAGPAADDEERRRRLAQLLENATGAERQASWVEALAVADSGRSLKSWELQGSTGVIADSVEPGPHPPGFWVFPLWYFPEMGKYYNQLSATEKDSLGDHWTTLKRLVREYFEREFNSPG